jgi:hypothetical protein
MLLSNHYPDRRIKGAHRTWRNQPLAVIYLFPTWMSVDVRALVLSRDIQSVHPRGLSGAWVGDMLLGHQPQRWRREGGVEPRSPVTSCRGSAGDSELEDQACCAAAGEGWPLATPVAGVCDWWDIFDVQKLQMDWLLPQLPGAPCSLSSASFPGTWGLKLRPQRNSYLRSMDMGCTDLWDDSAPLNKCK